MTTLPERLADLAEGAPVTPPPPDLWREGKRRARRRRAATAGAAVVAAAFVGIASSAVVTRVQADLEPAGAPDETVLPDRFYEPSSRLPVEHGRSGPLVRAVPAEHVSWTGRGEVGLVGVSAADQSYAFLDLPDWVGDELGDGWSLSPNGRWVAFWYGQRQTSAAAVPADGIGVLDTTTGEVRRHDLGTDLGVQVAPLGWSGDTLWFSEWDYTELSGDSASASRVASWSWDLADDAPQRVDDPHQVLDEPHGSAGEDGFLARSTGGAWYVIRNEADLSAGRVARFDLPSTAVPDAAAVSPDARSLALTQTTESGSGSRALTGALAGDETVVGPLEAELGTYPYLVGWIDDETLAVQVVRGDERFLVAVDVATGEQRDLATFEQAGNDSGQFATDLLDSPVVDALAPPRPWDPVRVAVSVALAALALLYVGLEVRRRRARR